MRATRFGKSSWLPGKTLFGATGFGEQGGAVPLSGDAGGGLLAQQLTLPDDLTNMVCCRVVRAPTHGVLTIKENSEATYVGSTDSADLEFFRNGVSQGVFRAYFRVGPAGRAMLAAIARYGVVEVSDAPPPSTPNGLLSFDDLQLAFDGLNLGYAS